MDCYRENCTAEAPPEPTRTEFTQVVNGGRQEEPLDTLQALYDCLLVENHYQSQQRMRFTLNCISFSDWSGLAVKFAWMAVGLGLFCLLIVSPYGFTAELIAQQQSAEIQRTARLMGTRATVRISAQDRGAAIAASEAVLREIARVEALLSTWIPSSELSRINHLPINRPTNLHPEVMAWLGELDELGEEFGRSFNPFVGALIDVWDLRGAGRDPTLTELEDALSATGSHTFKINSDQSNIVRLDPAAWIDAGGFGKGIALRLAADTLRARGGSGVLDLGGQLVVVGDTFHQIDILGPGGRLPACLTKRTSPTQSVIVSNTSVATSGLSERVVVTEQKRLGHILDPRNGQPAIDWGVVTVAAEDPLVADVLSTALFVLGPEQGMQLAERLASIGVLLQEHPLRSRTSEVACATGSPGSSGVMHTNEKMQELLFLTSLPEYKNIGQS
jgi:thiamine biosynthesis lipoprotein